MEVLDKLGRLVRDPAVQVDMTGFIFALIVSAIAGLVVSAFYQIFYENRATGAQVHRSFMLMAPSITALFIAIQFSLPLSLGLLGALSIIRFRTPIKEPEEVAFIMLLIACAVVSATFQFVLLFGLLSVALALLLGQKFLPRVMPSNRHDGTLLITLNQDSGSAAKENIIRLLHAKFSNGQVEGISYDEDLTTINYSFTGFNLETLNGFEASLRETASLQKLNVFFNKRGPLL